MADVQSIQAPFKPDNERLDKFIDLYLEYDGDAQQAWVDAGYSEGTKRKAMTKVRDNWKMVEARIVAKIGSHVPFALGVVYDLAKNAKGESVKLKAAQDLLGRAGFDQASKIEVSNSDPEKMDKDSLRKELTDLMAKATAESA